MLKNFISCPEGSSAVILKYSMEIEGKINEEFQL